MKRTSVTASVIATCLGAGLLAWTTIRTAAPTSGHVAAATAGAPSLTAPWRRPSGSSDTSPWRPGSSHRYAVETMSEVELGEEDAGETLFFGIEAELALTVVKASDTALELRGGITPGAFSFGSGAGDTGGGAAAETALRASLARPFHVSIDAAGRVASLRFAPGTDSMSMGIVRSVLTTAQFVRPAAGAPAAGTWTVLEEDGMGEYEARYAATGERAYTKTKGAYVRVSTETGLVDAGPDAPRAELDAKFVLGADGELVSVEAEQTVGRRMGDMFEASGKGRLSMRLLDVRMDPAALAAWEREASLFSTMTASQVNVPADADRQHWSQLLGGATLPELLGRLRELDLKTAATDARMDLMTQLTALLALQPETTGEVAALARSLDPARAGLVVSALAGAATTEAQAAIVDIMRDPSVDPALREHSVQLLGMTENPTPETAAAVEALAKDGGDLGYSATLALGNVADGLGRTSDAAKRVIDQLTNRLHAARTDGEKEFALAALGNTASPLIVDVVRPYLGDPTPTVRMAAVGALRLVSDGRAHEAIAGVLVGDADASVRAKAAQSMDYTPVPLYLEASAKSLSEDPDAHVRKQVVLVVARRFAHLRQGAGFLAWVRANDADADVRTAATPAT